MPPSETLPSWIPDWSAVEPSSLTLLIGWETSRTKVQIRRFPVTQDVAAQLQIPVEKTIVRLKEATPIAYSPDLELADDEYAFVSREQLDPDASLLTGLETPTPYSGMSSDLEKTLLFYAIAVGPAEARLIFLRQLNPRRYLKDKFFAMFSEQLTTVEKPLLSFDLDEVDLILVHGAGLIVRHLKVYERLFRDSPELLAQIGTKVNDLNALLPLTLVAQEALTAAARSNIRVRSRLLATLARGHLTGLQVDVVKQEMSRHGIDPEAHFDDGKLTFGPSEAMTIMQVLNEDLAIGGLSATGFVINKKSPRA